MTDLSFTYALAAGIETAKCAETGDPFMNAGRKEGTPFMNATRKENKISVVSSIDDTTSYVNVSDERFVKSDVRKNGLLTVTMDTASRVANITAQDNNTVEPVTCTEKDNTTVKLDRSLESITVIKNTDNQSVINGLASYLHDIYIPSEQNICLSASLPNTRLNLMKMHSVTNLKSCIITTNSEFDISGFRPRIKYINSVLTKSNYACIDAGAGYKLNVTGGGKDHVKINIDPHNRSFDIKTSMRSNSGEMVYGAVIEDNDDGNVTNIAIEYERFDHGECGDVNILHYSDGNIAYTILLTDQQIVFYPGRYVSAAEGVPFYPDMIRLAFVSMNDCAVPRGDKLVNKRIILGDEIDATRLKKWITEGIEAVEYNRFGNIPGCIDRVKEFGTDTLCAIIPHLIPDSANKYENKALFDAMSSGAFELLYSMLRFDYLNYNDEMSNRDFETEIIHYIIKSKINHNVLDHAQIMSRNLINTFYAPRKGNSVKFVDKPI